MGGIPVEFTADKVIPGIRLGLEAMVTNKIGLDVWVEYFNSKTIFHMPGGAGDYSTETTWEAGADIFRILF
jgi:hypothetical protein